MANMARRIGSNIEAFLQEKGISVDRFAETMKYSVIDAYNLIEGKVIVAPSELKRVADFLGIGLSEMMNCDSGCSTPELQYRKEFSDTDNLDIILDLMDEYVELKNVI